MSAEPRLDIDDIQGHLLPGFGTRFQLVLTLRLLDAESVRASLLTLTNDHLSTARDGWEQRDRRQRAFIEEGARPNDPNVLVGLALGIQAAAKFAGDQAVDRIEDEFVQLGMSADAAELGDPVDDGQPLNWRYGGTPETTPDLVLFLGGEILSCVEEKAEQLLDLLSPAVEEIHRDRGEMVLNDGPSAEFEHFGFRDGISQPVPRGLDDHDQPLYSRKLPAGHALAKTHADFGRPLIWPGQFLFGYAKQAATDPVRPSTVVADAGVPWLLNGSLLVMRRLTQNVEAFWSGIRAEAARFSAEETADWSAELLAAKLVGRWKNGTPLMRSPGAETQIAARAINHFGFGTATPAVPLGEAGLTEPLAAVDRDGFGLKCPFAAHIRKVNPRDRHEGGVAAQILLHLILRRGIAFGPPFDQEPEAERGLLFACYQTSIANQFRFVQTQWANSETFPGRGQDRIIGQGPSSDPVNSTPLQSAPGQDVDFVANPDWVRSTGGGYFLVPGLSGLRSLVAGVVA